ncbi:hypothetical protein M2271_002009 [Streptomyces sp. LBL]|uniref:hypothetical protein n=1 Tax=Streptomyces sp. LBL TaxID=2940562 RepID=UPI0024752F7D|nr:hypothetical protein [Streptomyces sp. LBL]MDH6624212.1 hypothetical protein [Streptomyces sp. LBL]
MKLSRPLVLLAVGAVVALALLAGIAYIFKLPPFREKGEIKAGEVCSSLGSSSNAVDALTKVLPEESSYSFDENIDLRTDVTDTNFESSCFVAGGGKQLLVAKARLMEDESATSWTQWVKGTASNEVSIQSLTPFTAGDTAVSSSRFAAVFVPCTSAGKAPGGQYNLSVSTELKQEGNTNDAAARDELIKLAKNAASYAHVKAKCDMAPNLGGTS